MARKLGILAGGGQLPGMVIEACRQTGRDFFVLAFKGQADPATVEAAPHEWIRLGSAGTGFSILRKHGVQDLVMAGRIRRPSLTDLRPDLRTMGFFARLGLKGIGDDGLLRAVIAELESEGFHVVGVDTLLPSLKAEEGVLGKHSPDAQADADIGRGVAVLQALGDVDVGQGVVVQQGIVLGVEAVEGTDAMLDRCARLKRQGAGGVLVKFSKPGQETRVDLPTIGPETISRATLAGLRGIAVEAGATIVVEREKLIQQADRAGLFVIGVARPQ